MSQVVAFQQIFFLIERNIDHKGRVWQSRGLNPLSYLIKYNIPSEIIFPQKSSTNKGCPPTKVPFANKGHLSTKVLIQQRSSSNKGCLPMKVIFHRRTPFTEGHLPTKDIFHQSSPTMTPWLILYL